MTRTAIIAGQGALAPALAARLNGAPVFALEGFAPEIAASPFRLERLVPFLDHLRETGVEQVVFAGAVRRPQLNPEAFDPETARLVPRIIGAMRSGDDAALRTVIEIFEEWDLTVCGIGEIAPDMLPGEGVLTGDLTDADRRDADRAAEILNATGSLDIGQGCVVAQGLCVALETLPGTDAMLDFVARHGQFRPDPAGGRGVVMKAPKPGQDRRIDLPTIGPATVDGAAAAGLAGIAFQADGVIMIDRQAVIRRAEAAGLFLWGRPA